MSELPLPQKPHPAVTPLTLTILHNAGPVAYDRLTISEPTPSAAHRALDGVAPQQLLSESIQHMDEAQALLAGLWLWQGALAESHEISQNLVSSTGSFWHAIMHRLEGDFSNAKYWYRRCAPHPVIKMLGAIASSLAGPLAADRTVAHALGDGWNPVGFVDLVQAVHQRQKDPRYELAVRLQRAEWIALFNHCVSDAVHVDHDGLNQWDQRTILPAGGD